MNKFIHILCIKHAINELSAYLIDILTMRWIRTKQAKNKCMGQKWFWQQGCCRCLEEGVGVGVVENKVIAVVGGLKRWHDVEDKVVAVAGVRATVSLRDVLGYFSLFKDFSEVHDTIWEVHDSNGNNPFEHNFMSSQWPKWPSPILFKKLFLLVSI